MCSKDNATSLLNGAYNLADCVYSIQVWHFKIENRNIREQLPSLPDRLVAIRSFSDYLNLFFFEEELYPLPDDEMIVSEKNAYWHLSPPTALSRLCLFLGRPQN